MRGGEGGAARQRGGERQEEKEERKDESDDEEGKAGIAVSAKLCFRFADDDGQAKKGS